jgi:nucleotide-binding universal stress UspA family protein
MTTSGSFSRILVPTDFSAGSEAAWRAAQRLAGREGDEIIGVFTTSDALEALLSVVERPDA